MFGQKTYLCNIRREKSPGYNKESVDAFILRNEIAKLNTRRMKGHDAHPFVYMSLRPLPYLHIRTAWEYCFCSFLVRRLAMPVSW